MTVFENVLVVDKRSPEIPPGHDIFGFLVGSWNFEYIDNHGTPQERHVSGEWIFERILDGWGIQDVFICPSRRERATHPQPDAEFGTTVRLYNPASGKWDIFYGCPGTTVRLEAEMAGNEIVLTEITNRAMQWIFSEITDSSFHWRSIEIGTEGKPEQLICELRATKSL